MKSLKVLGILNIIAFAITILCVLGNSASETVGVWAFIALGLGLALSIVGIVQSNKHTHGQI